MPDYLIRTYTGTRKYAGTDADVSIIIYGNKSNVGYILNDKNDTNDFESGDVNTIRIAAPDLGDLEKIYITHNGKGSGSDWYLERVEIDNLSIGESWNFKAGRWIDKKGAVLYAERPDADYSYLTDYPSDRENGWSDEIHGVCHDEQNWFFTQETFLWKFPLSHDLKAKCSQPDSAKGILRARSERQMGDCDCANGYVFVPTNGSGSPCIEVYDANTLEYVTKQTIKKYGNTYDEVQWCAINPTNGRLYTSDKHISYDFGEESSPVIVYDINYNNIKSRTGDFLSQVTYVKLYDSDSTPLNRRYVRGGCFDLDNHLHITNGDETLKGSINYANENGGISVFTIPQIPTANVDPFYRAVRIAKSEQENARFRFSFGGNGEQPQGITFWDLTSRSHPGDYSGCLHAIMRDKFGVNDDDLFFRHYSRTRVIDKYYHRGNTRRRLQGIIITTKKYGGDIDEPRRRKKNRQMVSKLFVKRGIDFITVADYEWSAIQKMIQDALFEAAGTEDMCYVYVNCHGVSNESTRQGIGLLIGYSERNKSNDWASYSAVKSIFQKIGGRKLFMLEACEAGAASVIQDSRIMVLGSSRDKETAIDDSVYGGWATRYWCQGAGHNFLAFADGMKADTNKDSNISIKELCDYANKKLKQNSRGQRCVCYSDDSDQIIFWK